MDEPLKPVILIPDNGPLGALAVIGAHALDCLFAFGVPVHITDMVIIEATRNKVLPWHHVLADWLEITKKHYVRVSTDTGREYLADLENWKTHGSPEALKPRSSDKGDRSIQDAVEDFEDRLADDETLVVIVDDRKLRRRLERANVNVRRISSRALFDLLADEFNIGDAAEMWAKVLAVNPTMDCINDDTQTTRKP